MSSIPDETYTTQNAAHRAGERLFPEGHKVRPTEDGRYAVEAYSPVPKKARKAKRASPARGRKAAPGKRRSRGQAKPRRKTAATGRRKASGAKVAKTQPTSKRAQAEADAQAGKLPKAPDFSARADRQRYERLLAPIVALVKAKDIAGLKAYPIEPSSSGPIAMARYRDLAVMALTAQAVKAGAP